MNSKKKTHWLRTLLVTASAGLLVGSMAYFVPDADAGRRGGRRGGGSVKQSSRSGARSGARAGGQAGSRSGARAGGSRTGTRQGAAAGSRAGGRAGSQAGGRAGASRAGAPRAGTPRAGAPRGGARRGGARAGYRAGRRDARYSARKDARRDWMRFRTVNNLIRTGAYLATRPRYSTAVVVGGTSYYYAGGVYYVNRGGRHVVVTAPPGAVVYAVPTATTVVYVGETPYYYYGGTYYVATDKPAETPEVPETSVNVNVTVHTGADGGETELETITSSITTEDGEEAELPPMPINDDKNYEVVSPPVGATVPYLADSAAEETVGGKTFLVHEGTYYRPFASDGETIYMVVEDPRQG